MKHGDWPSPDDAAAQGLLLARPLPRPSAPHFPPGLQPLGTPAAGAGLLYIPTGYRPDTPAPMVLMLHGAGGDARGGMAPFLPVADEAGMILLSPQSRSTTWDMIGGEYGPDVSVIDRTLAHVFDRLTVDPSHLAIEGFSDGASYALSLGTLNGALFSHVIAFSPGFAAPARQEARPAIFVSHGLHDRVLPIDPCSRSIVPRLRRAGYGVLYREFDGAHAVPEGIAREALNWFMAPGAQGPGGYVPPRPAPGR